MSRTYTHFNAGGYRAPKKYNKSIKGFVGVDYLNNATNVNDARGTLSNNYVWRGNNAQKRWAYDKIAYVPSEKFRPISEDTNLLTGEVIDNPNDFNGMWSFVADDGERHYIAHIGHLLYEVTGIASDRPNFTPIFENRDGKTNCSVSFEDYKSFAWPGQHRLWFLGGNRFYMIYYANGYPKYEQVAYSDYAFVPTTTIGITYKNAKAGVRHGLDYPNLMSAFRQNLLLSGVGKSEDDANKTTFYEYTLDAPIVPREGKEADDMYGMTIEISATGTIKE